ncbi:MAG: GHKL domain-containing protein [Clostridiales bacterium]|nr:GHKL domain-containing protein [Clostridiales bacterium]
MERLAEITTVFLQVYFLYRTLETKIKIRRQFIAGTVFLCIRLAYYIIGLGYRPYFSVLAGIVYAGFVFRGKFTTRMVWTVIPVVLDGIVDAAIISLYILFPDTSTAQVDAEGPTRALIIIAAKATLFATYHLITGKIDKSHIILFQDCISMLTVPIGCWIMLEFVFQYADAMTDRQGLPLMAAGSFVLLLMMASTVALYNRITANTKELMQSKLQLRTSELTQDHIRQINNMYSQLSSIRHDLRNHFVAISGYLKAKNYDALEQYVGTLNDVDMSALEYVNHPVLNALICSRMAMAKEKTIDFTANVALPANLPIKDVDLCILVSNILDNAFEANEGAMEPKFISLCTRVVNSYWVVACRNATRRHGQYRTSRALKSTKEIEGIHSIGTREIQEVAEKSGGFVTYRHENYEFTTLATIKLPT